MSRVVELLENGRCNLISTDLTAFLKLISGNSSFVSEIEIMRLYPQNK